MTYQIINFFKKNAFYFILGFITISCGGENEVYLNANKEIKLFRDDLYAFFIKRNQFLSTYINNNEDKFKSHIKNKPNIIKEEELIKLIKILESMLFFKPTKDTKDMKKFDPNNPPNLPDPIPTLKQLQETASYGFSNNYIDEKGYYLTKDELDSVNKVLTMLKKKFPNLDQAATFEKYFDPKSNN